MSDAFLESDLTLDIRAALGQVDRLNEALARATTGIRVTADVRAVTTAIDAAVEAADSSVALSVEAAPITGAIDAAIEEADTAVTVTGDAASLTGDIDAAIDNADTAVTVTGTASDVTASIDGAVEAADTSVTVTGDVDPGLRTSVVSLDASLDDAAESGSRLGTILAGIGVVGTLAAVRALADAASDLQESTSKAQVVFGEEFQDVQAFAEGAATSTGLANQEALEATATFGNLFQALGTSREEAARLSPEVVQLAADLASFNNLAVDETLEKLRSGLVGEVEPLRSLGVSFLAADVAAKGLELGLGDVNGVLSEGEKVQARYALIVEQTSLAQGDFARTSDGLANQQRILEAELGNAAAAAGTALLPALLAIVTELREAIPSFGEFAGDVLPAVAAAIENLAPLIGTTADILVALAPAIALVAELLAAIPDEAIALGAGLVIANKAIGGLTTLTGGLTGALRIVGPLLTGTASAVTNTASSVGPLAGGITKAAAALGALSAPAAVAIAVSGALFLKWQEGREEARRFQGEVDELTAALTNADGAVRLSSDGIAKYIEESSRFEAKNQLDDLDRLGLSYAATGALAAEGAAGLQEFTDRAEAAGEITEVFAGQNNELVNAAGEVVGTLGTMTSEYGEVQKVGDRLLAGNTDLLASFEELAEVQAATAEATVLTAEASGTATQAQVDHALALATGTDGVVDYVKALEILGPAIDRSTAAAQRSLDEFGPLAAQYVDTGEALIALRDNAPEVASAISGIRTGVAGSDRDFLDLATAISGAALSEEDFADAAALLGTDVDTLKGFVEDANQAVADFADTATSALPTVADAFEDLNDNGKVSAGEFRQNLDDQANDMRAFTLRLAALTEEGFGELAGVIAQRGPEVGGALAEQLVTALGDGNRELVESTQASLDNFDDAWTSTTAYLRDTLGPEFVLTTGLIGNAATTTFGDNLDFGERLRIAGAVAALEMDQAGQAVAAIAATEGEAAAREYGNALNLDDKTVEAAVAAGKAIKTNAPTGAAKAAGISTGEAFADGVNLGISYRQERVNDKAQQLVLQAKAAADRAARSQSPSRLFAELGAHIAEGLALGIEDSTALVEQASVGLVDAVATGVSAARVSPSLVGLEHLGAIAETSRAGDSILVRFESGAIVVHPAPGMTREEAVEIGEGIGEGMETRLAERSLGVLGRAE